MTRKSSTPYLVIALILSLLVPAAFAAETGGDTIATTYRSAVGLDWQLNVAHDGGMITIAGPDGAIFESKFGPGENPYFQLSDLPEFAIDGTYNYQMWVAPRIDASTRQLIDASGDAADRREIVRELRRAGKIPSEPYSQSGSFTVVGGSIVDSAVEEAATKASIATKDQVFVDDLIVDGSACIGTDCANGENFGFDTLRLKENNLRIKFDDTSSSGSFPFTDWQLLANESDNGGLNKFSIEDTTNNKTPFTIEASAPNNALYVSDGGEVGFGTNAPVVELHVKDGDSPTLRLEQDGSSGFQSQTWDVAGNETNFFVRDVTNGSKLPFKIIPNAPTNSLYVAASGNVGIGTSSPDQKLDVDGGDMRVTKTSGTDVLTSVFIENTAGTNDSSWALRANGSNGALLIFDVSGGSSQAVFRIDDGAAQNALRLTSAGATVTGSLTVSSVVSTGGNAGTDVCIDTNGVLCPCGSCS